MTIVEATAQRTINLMKKYKLTQKMFEEKSKLPHRSMNKLLLRKYKDINVKLLHKIANGFNLSIYQFIDDELFDMSNIEYKDNKK